MDGDELVQTFYLIAGGFGIGGAIGTRVGLGRQLDAAVFLGRHILPLVIGLLTMASVRSAPVTPPRRAT